MNLLPSEINSISLRLIKITNNLALFGLLGDRFGIIQIIEFC